MKETLKEHREITLAISGLLLFAPHAMVLFLGFIYLFKEMRNHLKVTIASSLLFIILIVIFPAYPLGAMKDYIQIASAFLDTAGQGNMILFLFSIPLRYSLASNIFLAHSAFVLSCLLRYIIRKGVKIEVLDDLLDDIVNKKKI